MTSIDSRHDEDPRLAAEGPVVLHDVNATAKVSEYLREVWRRREFAVAVPVGQMKAQHMNTLLGNVWHVLNPLLLVGVYYLVFGVILRVDRGIPHYLAFLTIGVFTYTFTSRSVLAGANSITGNEGLLRSIYFPRAILPLSTVIAQTLTYLPALFVMFFVTVVTGAGIRVTWLFFPLVLAVQLIFNLGATFIVARANESVRDLRNLLPYLFRIGIYLSGAMYEIGRRFGPTTKTLFVINPMYSFLGITRGVLMGQPTTRGMYLSVALWTIVLIVGGFFFFRAHEHKYGR